MSEEIDLGQYTIAELNSLVDKIRNEIVRRE